MSRRSTDADLKYQRFVVQTQTTDTPLQQNCSKCCQLFWYLLYQPCTALPKCSLHHAEGLGTRKWTLVKKPCSAVRRDQPLKYMHAHSPVLRWSVLVCDQSLRDQRFKNMHIHQVISPRAWPVITWPVIMWPPSFCFQISDFFISSMKLFNCWILGNKLHQTTML